MSKACPIELNGEKIKTVTSLYDALKYTHLSEIQEKIISVSSPVDAINISKTYSSQARRDWEDIKLYVI